MVIHQFGHDEPDKGGTVHHWEYDYHTQEEPDSHGTPVGSVASMINGENSIENEITIHKKNQTAVVHQCGQCFGNGQWRVQHWE